MKNLEYGTPGGQRKENTNKSLAIKLSMLVVIAVIGFSVRVGGGHQLWGIALTVLAFTGLAFVLIRLVYGWLVQVAASFFNSGKQ